MLHPLGALVAPASTWSHRVKLGGHVNAQPPIAMKQLCTILLQLVCKLPRSQTLRGESLALAHRPFPADSWLLLQATGRSGLVRQCQCDTSEGHGGSLKQAVEHAPSLVQAASVKCLLTSRRCKGLIQHITQCMYSLYSSSWGPVTVVG